MPDLKFMNVNSEIEQSAPFTNNFVLFYPFHRPYVCLFVYGVHVYGMRVTHTHTQHWCDSAQFQTPA